MVHLSSHSPQHHPESPAKRDTAVLEAINPQESGGQPLEQGRNRTSTPEKLASLAPLLPLLAQLKNYTKDSFEMDEVGHYRYWIIQGHVSTISTIHCL